MSSTPKTQKDKPHTALPKLTPRATAASAARAARNATNRNLLPPQAQRQSPSRAGSLPPVNKGKAAVARNPSKCESKSDVKLNQNPNVEIVNTNVTPRQEIEAYFTQNNPVVVTDAPKDEIIKADDITVLNEDIIDEQKCDDENTRNITDENTDRTTDQFPHSRPQTPALSRPQTPKSLQSSRPQTPHILSRPTTPVHPHHGTPASRPNTPQLPSRPTTPANSAFENLPEINSLTNKIESPTKEDEDLKMMYSLKQKQFHTMKKELDLKQQAVLEIFDSLRGLRDRMCQEGLSGSGEGLPQQELVVFNVADWATEEIAQLCHDATSPSTDEARDVINSVTAFDERAFAEIDAKLTTVPARFADLCLQAFTARQEIVDWMKDTVEKIPETESDTLERIAKYNENGFQLCEALRELKSCADSAINSASQLSRKACQERSSLAALGQSLVREVARLREDIEAQTTTINELRQIQNDSEISRLLEETRRKLEEEKAGRLVAKDKLSTAESQLKQARGRISKMDRQLREAETSIASLTGTVKTLEDQSRQKEVQLEARARKLRESLKTAEMASSHIAQQRDALQAEVTDLKEQFDKVTAQHKMTLQDLTNQLMEAKRSLEEQKEINQRQIEHEQALQVTIEENHTLIEELRAKITELENSRPNPDLPTEREMDLWADLQATKETLRMTEEEITACKQEKIRFLETMAKITDSDNKVSMQHKLAAELLTKEEVVGKMQIQIRELTKNIKLNEQKLVQYEQYARQLQEYNHAVANRQEAPNGISYQDLEQEIMNLKMGILDANHRNEELTELLIQKDQQLDQQEKTSRAQARILKVREELINMLKNKETEQGRELTALQQDLEHRMNIVSEVNKQIAAKADEIQDLFATLENKQQQIHRLEKIVLALEEQQRRAQAQRTRHEEKIAALEHELAANESRRERKYLFF